MNEFNQGLSLGVFVGTICGMFIMCVLSMEREVKAKKKIKEVECDKTDYNEEV